MHLAASGHDHPKRVLMCSTCAKLARLYCSGQADGVIIVSPFEIQYFVGTKRKESRINIKARVRRLVSAPFWERGCISQEAGAKPVNLTKAGEDGNSPVETSQARIRTSYALGS